MTSQGAEVSQSPKFYLQQQTESTIEIAGGRKKVFQRRAVSSKKLKEIYNIQRINESSSPGKKLLRIYRLCAEYCLGITNDIEFESAIWEDDPDLVQIKIFGLKSVLDA